MKLLTWLWLWFLGKTQLLAADAYLNWMVDTWPVMELS